MISRQTGERNEITNAYSPVGEIRFAVEITCRVLQGTNRAALLTSGVQPPLMGQKERLQALVPDLKLVLILADLRENGSEI